MTTQSTFVNVPHKGEMLDRIFAHKERLNLNKKMVQLFLKHNMKFMDLTELREHSQEDYDLWQKMHKRSNRLMALSTYTVLER